MAKGICLKICLLLCVYFSVNSVVAAAGNSLAISVDSENNVNDFAEVYWLVDANSLPSRNPECSIAFSFSDKKLFKLKNGEWIIITPAEEQTIYNIATGNQIRYQKGAWQVFPKNNLYNVKDYGARGDYNLDLNPQNDDTAAIQYVIDKAGTYNFHGGGGIVYLPAGRYHITKTLNMTTDLEKNKHSHMVFRGDGPQGTVLYAGTGGILFDCTGSIQMTLEHFRVYGTHVAKPSTVGILFARGQKNNWAINCTVKDVKLTMVSDPYANKGIGTVGIWAYAAEHHRQEDVWIEANLALVLTYALKPSGLPAMIESPYVELSKQPPSHEMGLMADGQCVYIAYDYHRPAIYMESCHDVYFKSAYLGVRRSPSDVKLGNYFHAIEAHNVLRFSHRGMLEVPGECGYVKNYGAMLYWDVKVHLGQQDPVNPDPENLKARAQPIILLANPTQKLHFSKPALQTLQWRLPIVCQQSINMQLI